MSKIFITGGKGILGSKLVLSLLSNHDVYAPDKKDCDITNLSEVKNAINQYQPDIVIHAAAYVDTFGCEKNPISAIDTNIIGTINLVKSILELSCKFVYISSEYVFGGDRGYYTVEDKLDPKNIYGKTKASSEYIVSILENYQIIRAPFIRKVYPKVFTDQYCSRYFLDEAVQKIIYNIMNNNDKIVHIATERMSLYDLYINKGIYADPITMDEHFLQVIPKDTSLINNSI
jgi:dTDP-4-dehydrorhamnose reductase